MNKTFKNLMICRYILILGPVLGTLIHIQNSAYPVFILLSLVIFINSQIRIMRLSNLLFLASLLVEVLLILYLHSITKEYIYLILFSSLIDAVLLLKDEIYFVLLFITAGLLFTLYPFGQTEQTLIILLFYIITFLLLHRLRFELEARADTEELYDRIRRSNYELESARARLINYSRQVEKLSQSEERNRISRELHDSIGHDLTGILMQVDASMQILPTDKEKGLKILSSAYQNINNCIEGVRQTVRKLRPVSYRTHIVSLEELIKKFQNNTGVNIELKTTGTPCPLYPGVEITLSKNTREALTNAVRHGYAKNIFIHFQYSSSEVVLTIKDDGLGAAEIKKGFGLSGMEERMQLVGGTITYSGEDGFCVIMKIPVREDS